MERYFILIHHLENPTKDLDYDVIKIIFNMKTTKTFALAVFEVLHLLL